MIAPRPLRMPNGGLGWAQCYWCSRWGYGMRILDSDQVEYNGNIMSAPWCDDCLEQEQCWRCLRWGNHDGPLCSDCDRQRCELLVWYCFTRLLEEAERQQADSFSQVTESVAPSSPLAAIEADVARFLEEAEAQQQGSADSRQPARRQEWQI